MKPAEPGGSETADVCLVLEGTYPYVRGGVSTWVHDLIRGLPELRFALVHIGPEEGGYLCARYTLPENVVSFTDLYCRGRRARVRDFAAIHRAAWAERRRHASGPESSALLRGIRRLHLEESVGDSLLDDFVPGDLSVGALLHGRASFELTVDLCERLAPGASFLDFFWHFRSMHLPLVRLLGAKPPNALAYHSVCTGYAGLLAAVWSRRMGRPLLLTEHGIYARERSIELERTDWLHRTRDGRRSNGPDRVIDGATDTALRRMWIRFFRTLARCTYAQASAVISLCEANRARQIADGAPAEKTFVVPNGIDPVDGAQERESACGASHRRLRVGFVGRLVPIKDIVTFIRACCIASRAVEINVCVFGPAEEDPKYARRCRRLVSALGLDRVVRFEGNRPMERIYPEIDILVLTSFSEAQPLVILEANAAGIPVVATDVGACRELLEGRNDEDRRIGPSGIVTRLAAPEETAAAIIRLARSPEQGRVMGEAGRKRVTRYYQKSATVATYRTLYTNGSWRESAGGSSA